MIYTRRIEKSENTFKKRSWPIGVGFIDYISNVQNAPHPAPPPWNREDVDEYGQKIVPVIICG
jgi:hypothetical protein